MAETTPEIEKAARAIHASPEYGASSRWPYGSTSGDVRACEAYAAAVLETLIEPSDAEVMAASNELGELTGELGLDPTASQSYARAVLHAAALARLGRAE